MPESRLFMSSLSRRQLARRRSGRSPMRLVLLVGLLVVLVCAAAVVIARGGI
jgi:hypothetical protein